MLLWGPDKAGFWPNITLRHLCTRPGQVCAASYNSRLKSLTPAPHMMHGIRMSLISAVGWRSAYVAPTGLMCCCHEHADEVAVQMCNDCTAQAANSEVDHELRSATGSQPAAWFETLTHNRSRGFIQPQTVGASNAEVQ